MGWTALTYSAGEVLTSAKMAQLQANAAAVRNRAEISASRDLSLADGNISYTGAGFTPRRIRCYAPYYNGTASEINMGASDGTTSRFLFSAVVPTAIGTGIVRLYYSATLYVTVTLVSFDSDGVTVTYTKTGSPIGTVVWRILLEG